MAERGDASPQDIDTAMELGAGYRKSRFTQIIQLADSSYVAMGVRYCMNEEGPVLDD